MRLRVVSDVHVEFHADGGVEWANALEVGECDALVVAGDFGTHATWMAPMEVLCRRFPRVLYVTGNHEYYGSSFDDVDREVAAFESGFDNFTRLDDSVVEVAGRRVIGTTMWFRKSPATWRHEWAMSDFRQIEDSHRRIYAANEAANAFLEANLREGDVVVTHHLPSRRCVSPRFLNSRLNAFFVNEVDALILERKPALWIHGHTHDSKDLTIGATRVVCNPFGYARVELNPDYDESKLVEV